MLCCGITQQTISSFVIRKERIVRRTQTPLTLAAYHDFIYLVMKCFLFRAICILLVVCAIDKLCLFHGKPEWSQKSEKRVGHAILGYRNKTKRDSREHFMMNVGRYEFNREFLSQNHPVFYPRQMQNSDSFEVVVCVGI